MLCPNCKTTLTMSDRQGIEIDFCSACRGVWLDRGELDKIIERSSYVQAAPGNRGDQAGSLHAHGTDGRLDRYPKRRKSFLSELFD